MPVFTVIEHAERAAPAATWTSGTFATTYDHLYIVMSMRTDTGTSYSDSTTWQFNGDTGANYSMRDLQTSTATPSKYRLTGSTFIGYPMLPGPSALADTFGATTLWIPNYANTTNFKSIFFSSTAPNASATNSQWALKLTAGMWSSTAALTSFSMGINGTHNFVQYSNYTVYGVTGA